jgi:hypothetical protein
VGWAMAAAAARLLLRMEALPVVVSAPDPKVPGDRGEIVAYSVKGPAAAAVATALATAGGAACHIILHIVDPR